MKHTNSVVALIACLIILVCGMYVWEWPIVAMSLFLMIAIGFLDQQTP